MNLDEFIEPVFGQDDFRKPKVLKGWEALVQSFLVVLFGKPGFYPSIPELGMNIQKYRNQREDEIDIESIKVEIAYQCSMLHDFISSGDIDVVKTLINNDTLALAFVLPLELEDEQNNVLVGIALGDEEISYNYQLVSVSDLEI